jgi:hypothetical protein
MTSKPQSQPNEHTVSVFRTDSAMIAEHMRFVLSLAGIPAIVNQGDPLRLAAAMADVLVQACDLAEARIVIEQPGKSLGDWRCRCCRESVPETFDSCWNCGEDRVSETSTTTWQGVTPNLFTPAVPG